jgi:nicotinate-nucleotide adenylyltransferase
VGIQQKARRPRFALFGGSFNPPHQGHVDLVRAVASRQDIQHLFAVPAGRSPFKGEEELLPGELRLEMLRAALRGMARASVLDLEVRRSAPSYTVETLQALRSWCPVADWVLVMGADAFRGFAGWRCANRLLEWASLAVFPRTDGGEPLPPEAGAWIPFLPMPWREQVRPAPGPVLLDEKGRALVECLDIPITPISSSRIRADHLLEAVAPGARELLQAYLDAQAGVLAQARR